MRVYNNINLEFEALTLFSKIVRADKRYSDAMTETQKSYMDSIYEDAIVQLEPIKEKVDGLLQFFEQGAVQNTNISLAVFVFKDYYEKQTHFDVHDFIESHLTNIIIGYDGNKDTSVFDILNQSGLKPNEKWFLLWVLENPESVVTQVALIVSTLEPIIKAHESLFSADVLHVAQQWQKLIDSNEIVGFLDLHLGLMHMDGVSEYYVSVLASDTIMFLDNKAFIGLQYTIDYFKSKQMTPETVVKAMKLMGDASKYGILKELLDGKKYGRELAQNLDLTAATISYHIQELLNEGLVGARSNDQNNRIYYDIRKNKIKDILDYVKKDLEVDKKGTRKGLFL